MQYMQDHDYPTISLEDILTRLEAMTKSTFQVVTRIGGDKAATFVLSKIFCRKQLNRIM